MQLSCQLPFHKRPCLSTKTLSAMYDHGAIETKRTHLQTPSLGFAVPFTYAFYATSGKFME
jgi:hypothetical protein